MAHSTSRAGDVQKSFYLREGLAARFGRVITARRKKVRKFTERRAMELAIRAWVEQEERDLGLAGALSPSELVEVIAEAAAELRTHHVARRA